MNRCLLALLSALAIGASPAAAATPNVLFISVDDLNDWVGVLGGHPQARTPNIDRLAARGASFSHAYAAAPACNPSRVALMSGLAPHRTGVYLNDQPWRPTMREVVTLPQYLRKHGYFAEGSGKIYHDRYPDPASWDVFWPSKQEQRPDGATAPGNINGIPGTAQFDWGPLNAATEEMSDSKVVDWIAAELGKAHEKPLFLAAGIYRPHLPWYVPKKYFDMFPLEKIELPSVKEDDLSDVPPAGVRMARPGGDHAKVIRYKQWKKAVQGYLASIAFADDMVGKIVAALDAGPHAEDTLIVLWGDHGWHLGEKQHWRKFTLWEEATRTPLIFVVPKGLAPGLEEGTKPGTRIDEPVSLLDIYPTLVELCGLAPKADLSGQSLVPLLRDPETEWNRPALTTNGRGNHGLRTERYRYIRYADGSEELYDHQRDPMEWKNLAHDSSYEAVKRGMQAFLPKTDAPNVPKP